jgi:O-antigen ligase
MFQSITRVILFLVGASLTTSTVVLGSVGPMIFSVARAAILMLLLWALLIWAIDRRRYPPDNRILWFIAFGVALAISLVTSFLSGQDALKVFFSGQQVVASMAFALLLAYTVSNRSGLDALLSGYIVSVVATSVSVLLFQSTGFVGVRSGGLGGDPNHFASEAALALPIGVLFFYTKRSVLWRVFLAGMATLALAAIMKSLSRTAIVAIMTMFGLWVLRFRRFDVLRFVLPVGVLLFVGLMFASADWRERMTTMTSSERMNEDESIVSRFQVAEYAFRAFGSNPVLGVGFEGFSDWAVEKRRYLRHADPASSRSSNLIYSGQAIHNAYLHVMAEMGLLGLVPFLAILILTWNQYSRAFRLAGRSRTDPEMAALYLYAIFLQLAFLGMLVASLFLSSLDYKSLWFVIGLSAVVLELASRRAAELRASAALQEAPLVVGADAASELGVPEPFEPWHSLN